MSDDVDLEEQLDVLFAGDPKDFTTTRDALARRLRGVDRATEASTVKALRRPTVAVGAVNRAARERPDLVAALVEVGDELAALQTGRDADREQLRELTRRRRTLLQQLTEHAARSTDRPESTRAAIAATLDAASLDPSLREELQRGRLTQELTAAARFVATDDAPASTTATRRSPSATRATAAPTIPRDELAARRARAELDAVKERAEEAEESRRERAEAADGAATRLDAAHRQVADLEAALADARAEVADAARAERESRRSAQRAVTEHERVIAALRAAERAVETNPPTG